MQTKILRKSNINVRISNKEHRVQGGDLPDFIIEGGEVVLMDTYQVLTLLFVSGGFLIALLTYIDKRK